LVRSRQRHSFSKGKQQAAPATPTIMAISMT
jgi:hypothetical protein